MSRGNRSLAIDDEPQIRSIEEPEIVGVPLADVLAKPKLVSVDSDTVITARDLGISLGD